MNTVLVEEKAERKVLQVSYVMASSSCIRMNVCLSQRLYYGESSVAHFPVCVSGSFYCVWIGRPMTTMDGSLLPM